MLVSVTENDIRKGIKSNACYCPVALALKKKLHKRVIVGLPDVLVTEKGWIKKSYMLTDELWKFICDFDKGKPVQPGVFEL